MRYSTMESPLGRLLFAGRQGNLELISLPQGKGSMAPKADWIEDRNAFTAAMEQMQEYFARKRRRFELVLAPRGTDFQLRVWWALAEIPYGETVTYGELARRLERPSASRAVGAANGSNPLPIVLPCHRVIGADGSLTGYGGGLEAKRFLLDLEGASLPRQLSL